MYKYGLFRQIGAAVAGLCGSNRCVRRLHRDNVRYHGLISSVGQTKLPRQNIQQKFLLRYVLMPKALKWLRSR